jgi:hypothetical protein
LQNKKANERSHYRSAETIRHSLRNGLRLLRALPGVSGLLASVADQSRRFGRKAEIASRSA